MALLSRAVRQLFRAHRRAASRREERRHNHGRRGAERSKRLICEQRPKDRDQGRGYRRENDRRTAIAELRGARSFLRPHGPHVRANRLAPWGVKGSRKRGDPPRRHRLRQLSARRDTLLTLFAGPVPTGSARRRPRPRERAERAERSRLSQVTNRQGEELRMPHLLRRAPSGTHSLHRHVQQNPLWFGRSGLARLMQWVLSTSRCHRGG